MTNSLPTPLAGMPRKPVPSRKPSRRARGAVVASHADVPSAYIEAPSGPGGLCAESLEAGEVPPTPDALWAANPWSPPRSAAGAGCACEVEVAMDAVAPAPPPPAPPASSPPVDVMETHRMFVRGCARYAMQLPGDVKRDMCRALRTPGVTHDTLLVSTGASLGQLSAYMLAQCPVRNRGARRQSSSGPAH